jgi:hypothetical protein
LSWLSQRIRAAVEAGTGDGSLLAPLTLPPALLATALTLALTLERLLF